MRADALGSMPGEARGQVRVEVLVLRALPGSCRVR